MKRNGTLELKSGGRLKRLATIFANPDLPEIDDYYEPSTFDYAHLQNAPLLEAAPTARPRSQIDGNRMEKIHWGPNWEDDLAGAFAERAEDCNFNNRFEGQVLTYSRPGCCVMWEPIRWQHQ